MKTYRVTIDEYAVYKCEIKARSRAEAERKAEKLFLESISLDGPFTCDVPSRDISAEEMIDG